MAFPIILQCNCVSILAFIAFSIMTFVYKNVDRTLVYRFLFIGLSFIKNILKDESSYFLIWHCLVYVAVSASAKMHKECAWTQVEVMLNFVGLSMRSSASVNSLGSTLPCPRLTVTQLFLCGDHRHGFVRERQWWEFITSKQKSKHAYMYLLQIYKPIVHIYTLNLS